ncbi:YlbF family regulator [Alicyclobacillus sp.]|uniref:YlbF family regulator n=1 Tax=Alicyclobacillus sp. TaxID=61169 RepID=UPI0025C29CB6|nr:YlbF family regulator [Alicyclobacillus sp.]MCL6517659.1 YlbF family regulator [Alicyclobacillus sp.]
MNPYDTAHALLKDIRGTSEFQRLKEVHDRLEKDESALRMLQDYRRREWEFQAQFAEGKTPSEEERRRFEQLTQVVMLNQDIAEYLALERHVTSVLMDIYQLLGKGLEDALFPHPVIQENRG